MISFEQWLAQKGISSPGPIQLHQLQAEYYRTVEYPAIFAGFMSSTTVTPTVTINPADRVTETDIRQRAFGFSRAEQTEFQFHYPQPDEYPEEWLTRGYTPDNNDVAWQAHNAEIRQKLIKKPVTTITGDFPVSGGSFEQGLENAKVATVWQSELTPDGVSVGEFRGSYFASLREELPGSTIRELDEGFLATAGRNKTKPLIKQIPHWARGVTMFGGLAAGIALLAATKPLSAFSGRDDEYNTIEGLRHDGIAAQKRRELTEFGSGWKGQGLPSSLMGVPIDEQILNFRADILDNPVKKQQYRNWEKGANSGSTPGQFTADDLFAYNTGTINAINEKNKELRLVHLNRFTIDVEDADTLLLKRKGIWHLFDEPIQVRLAGIDAPEVAAHADDPLEPIRIWQDQPLGNAAADRLRGILEQQTDPQLVISATDQTYGRYLGVVAGDNGENINLSMLRMGAVADLPFGNPEDDILKRSASRAAQEQAVAEQIGLWSQARYQAIHEVTNQLGTSITFNTFTRVDKLAGNLSLGAYASWLHQLDYQQSDLSARQVQKARQFAKVLSKNYGPNQFSGRDDNYNSIEGLRHGGVAQFIRHAMTEFGSGWDPLRKIATQGSFFSRIKALFGGSAVKDKMYREMIHSVEFQKALDAGVFVKDLGHGAMGQVKLFESEIFGKKFQFAEKFPISSAKMKDSVAEVRAMETVQDLGVPTPYGITKSRHIRMEYVEGRDIDKAYLNEGLTTKQIDQIEASLKEMHHRGIAHTDLSQDIGLYNMKKFTRYRGELVPRNMMITPKGDVAILDMGLSQSATATPEGKIISPLHPKDATLGQHMSANSGIVVGTAAEYDNLIIESLRANKGKVSPAGHAYRNNQEVIAPNKTLELAKTEISGDDKMRARQRALAMAKTQLAVIKDMMTPGKGRNHITKGVTASTAMTVR